MKMYASADHISRWEDIDFHVAEQNVKKLQRRIAAAFRNSELDKAASLQERSAALRAAQSSYAIS